MSLKQGINLTIRNVVVALTLFGVLFASTNVLAAAATPAATDIEYSKQQLLCLAKNIYFEAGGESIKGKEAVAHVTLNRVYSGQFPTTICSVVKQRSRGSCQFSWVCQPVMPSLPWGSKNWKDSILVAEQVLDGDTVDPTFGATFFHAKHVRPSWSRTHRKTAIIGNHIFYRTA